jgi:hypothetical protein
VLGRSVAGDDIRGFSMNFNNTPTNFTSSLIALIEHCDKCGNNYEILRDSLTDEVFGECAICKNMASKIQDADTILSELAEIKKDIQAIKQYLSNIDDCVREGDYGQKFLLVHQKG